MSQAKYELAIGRGAVQGIEAGGRGESISKKYNVDTKTSIKRLKIEN